MERQLYSQMADLDGGHWWFLGRQRIVANLLTRYPTIPTSLHILEIECGTGGNLAMLARFGQVSGVKPDAAVSRFVGRNWHFDINSASQDW